MAHHGKPGQHVPYKVSIPSRDGARGLYLRDATELNGLLTMNVEVAPQFEHANIRTEAELEELLGLEVCHVQARVRVCAYADV